MGYSFRLKTLIITTKIYSDYMRLKVLAEIHLSPKCILLKYAD